MSPPPPQATVTHLTYYVIPPSSFLSIWRTSVLVSLYTPLDTNIPFLGQLNSSCLLWFVGAPPCSLPHTVLTLNPTRPLFHQPWLDILSSHSSHQLKSKPMSQKPVPRSPSAVHPAHTGLSHPDHLPCQCSASVLFFAYCTWLWSRMAQREMVQLPGSGKPGFKDWLCHLLGIWFQVNYFNYLNLKFSIKKARNDLEE
jgi:hypothetical protein